MIQDTEEIEAAYVAHNWPRWVSLAPSHSCIQAHSAGDGIILPDVSPELVTENKAAFEVLRQEIRKYRPKIHSKSAALCFRGRCYTRSYVPGTGCLGKAGEVFDFCIRRHFGLLFFDDQTDPYQRNYIQSALGPYIGQQNFRDTAFIFLSDDIQIPVGGGSTTLSLLMWLPSPSSASEISPTQKNNLDAFFEVIMYLFSESPVCEIYQLIDHGRCTQRTLVFTSDTRSSLRYISTDNQHRQCPLPEEVKYSGGHVFGGHVSNVTRITANPILKRIVPRNPYEEKESDYDLRSEVGQDIKITGFGDQASYSGISFTKRNGVLSSNFVESKMSPVLLIQRHVSFYQSGCKRSWKETFVPFRDLAGMHRKYFHQNSVCE